MKELVISRHRHKDGEGSCTVLTLEQDSLLIIGTDRHLTEVLGYHNQDLEGRTLKQLIASPEDNPLSGDYTSFHQSGKSFNVTLRHGRGYFMAASVIVRPDLESIQPPTSEPSESIAPKSALPVKDPRQVAHDQKRRSAIASTRAMLVHIRESLNEGGLPLEYQPIEALEPGESGLRIEVFARLRGLDPDNDSPLTPQNFLPLTERFELSRRLDRKVIRQTICHLMKNRQLVSELRYCGFNLSLGSIEDNSFPEYVQKLLAASGLEPSVLCFELAACHAVSHPEASRHQCRVLRQLGCKVALDGAGATIESFKLASRLPVDWIKLAPALMRNLHEEPTHQLMIEALQRIARSSGKAAIATCIENDISRRRAQSLGIRFIQGTHVGKTRPLKELLTTDNRWQHAEEA